MSTKFNASTILNYSPRKSRLVINAIRGLTLSDAIVVLATMGKGKNKKFADLLKSAANNLKLTDNDFTAYKIDVILAEEAQKLYRVVPRARGSAFRIRRRYSRIKVAISQS